MLRVSALTALLVLALAVAAPEVLAQAGHGTSQYNGTGRSSGSSGSSGTSGGIRPGGGTTFGRSDDCSYGPNSGLNNGSNNNGYNANCANGSGSNGGGGKFQLWYVPVGALFLLIFFFGPKLMSMFKQRITSR